ncbi:hypothetical protein MMC10_001922 [Thelotrema lepadinum]|nr:hypothetical protein [Thelotrema lepadinum]
MNTSTKKSLKRKAASPTPSSSSELEAEDSPYALSTHMPWPSQLAGHKDELEGAERKAKKIKQERVSGEELVGEQSGQFEGSDAESKFVVKITGI